MTPGLAIGVALTAGLIVLLVGVVSPPEQVRAVIPCGLLGLAGIILAGRPTSSAIGAVLVVVGIALALAPALAGVSEAARAAGRRYLAWMIVAGCALLFSAALDHLQAREPALNLSGPIAALFVVGIGILLAAPPFSLWLPALAEETPGLAALTVGLLGCGAAMISGEMVASGPLRLVGVTAPPGFAGAGGILAVIAALAALGEPRPRRSFAFLISASAGLLVAYVAAGSRGTPSALIFALSAHALAAALGLGALAAARGPLDGLIWHRPLTGTALIVSALGLIGLPLTAAFVGRTLLAQSMLDASPVLLIASGLTGVIGGLAFLRNFGAIFARIDLAPAAPRLADLIALGLALALLLRGLAPGALRDLLR